MRETPPRAWGRPPEQRRLPVVPGNTPTGVGKTNSKPSQCAYRRKHPHGRGEDLRSRWRTRAKAETPPRAWGRLPLAGVPVPVAGNTPTGVGKTSKCQRSRNAPWKHPHGRGEDSLANTLSPSLKETPPRAWGRPSGSVDPYVPVRNTPTGVGKTTW